MEKIIRIEDVSFNDKKDYGYYDGYQIVTEKQTIKLGICNSQSCCENWGYFMSEDNLSDFVDAEFIKLEITDTCLNTKKLDDEDLHYANTMFVNIFTSKGMLQFVAYNSHNGYYGHEAVIFSDELNHTESL